MPCIFAYLETEIEFTITAMSALAHNHYEIPFGFGDRMKCWKKLLPAVLTSPHAVKHYTRIIALATKAHETRSSLLHGRVLGDPQKKTRYMSTEHHQHRKGAWNSDTYFASPQRLARAVRIVGQIAYSLISLNRRYLPIQPYALPNRYPELSPAGHPRALPGRIDKSIQKARPRSLKLKLLLERTEP